MLRYTCIGFIDFTLKDKSLTDFTKLFHQKNDIISNYFKNGWNETPKVYPNL